MIRCGIEDIDFVDSILKDDSIYPLITDDFSPSAYDYTALELIKNNDVHIISPNKHTVVLFLPKNGTTWEIHYNVLSEGRGEMIRTATIDILNYAFEDILNCKKLVCYIAEIHNNVIDFAIEMGMKHEGRLKKSIQKNNKLYDEVVLGMRSEEWQR